MSYRSSQRLYKKNKDKKSKVKIKLKPFLALLLIVIALMAVYRFYFYVPKYIVNLETWYYSSPAKARLVLKNIPIIATQEGIVHIEVEDQSLVNQDQNLMSIVDSDQEERIRQRIEDIQQELLKFDIILDENGNEIVKEPLNNPLSEIRIAIRHYGIYQKENNIRALDVTFNRIQELEQEYHNYIKEIDNNQTRYDSLKQELKSLQTEYEDCSVTIIAPASGYLTFEYDNLTQSMPYDKVLDDYRNILGQEVIKNKINDGDLVSSGNIVANLIEEDIYYLIVNIPENIRKGLIIAENIKVSYEDKALDAKLLTENLADDIYLWSISSEIVSLKRDIDVIIATERLEGYKVPKSAVLTENESFYIYVYDGRYPVKTEVEVLKEEDTHYFVIGLNNGDEIVEDIEQFRR